MLFEWTAVQRLKGHTIRAVEDAERYTSGGYYYAVRIYFDGSVIKSFDVPSRNNNSTSVEVKSEGANPIDGDYKIVFISSNAYISSGYCRKIYIQVNGFDYYVSDYVYNNSQVDSGTITFS